MKTRTYLGLSKEGFHRITYSEWGASQSHNPPILCVHGLTRNRRDFDSLGNYLSKQGLHIYCPDMVGRGDSDYFQDARHYTFEQNIADMNNMICRMEMRDQLDWIGTSIGGLLGMFIASIPGNPIRRLIMNDIGPFIPSAAIRRINETNRVEPEFKSLAQAKQYFKENYTAFGNLTDDEWQTITVTSVKEIAPGRWIRKIDPGARMVPSKMSLIGKLFLHPLKAIQGTLFDIDLWDVWHKVTCKVLVIRGKNSDFLRPETIAKMKAIHPQTDVYEIEGVGHAPPLLDIKYHKMIGDWLKSDEL